MKRKYLPIDPWPSQKLESWLLFFAFLNRTVGKKGEIPVFYPDEDWHKT